MTLVREAGAKLIHQFTVPYKGTWQSVSANMLSPDSLYNSNNVFIRKGKLRERPGLSLLNSTVFDSPVKGGAMAVTPVQKRLLAFTESRLYTTISGSSSWVIDTSSLTNVNPVDVTFLETSSQYVAVIANGSQALKRWIEGSGVSSITASVGTVPVAKSVCTAARRIIYLIDPHTVGWTASLTYDNYPALAIYKLAQTNDLAICVRSLSNLTFVVYKERSIYLARAQAGSDSSAFGFSEPIKVEGPAGIHAVCDVNGTHFYMTPNGRVAIFDGSQYPKWIADGLWLYLQGDIDPIYAKNIFAVFDYRLHTVTFHYPRITDTTGLMTGLLIINLPLEGSGIDSYPCFKGVTSKSVSFGYNYRFNEQIDRSLLFTSTSGDVQSFNFDENVRTDDEVNFDCSFQTGLFPLPEMRHSHISVESFLERADGNGSVDIYAVASDALENETGTKELASFITIDLNNNPIQEYLGFNKPTRFFGLQYEWVSSSKVRYAGAALYGRAVS